MRFAVIVKGHGFNVNTTGVILIVIGISAVLSSLLVQLARISPRRG